MKSLRFVLVLSLYFIALKLSYSQSPGLIVRTPGGTGVTSLNPNGDGYSSLTTSGFTTDDIAQSEISYVNVPVAIIEPTGDLATGPSGGFSDIVKRTDGSGFYLYKDATNIYFRMRIGSIVSGSKGYSALLDTDGKMGASGPNADPNYLAPGGTNSGNPGFEYEITFESNSRVAVYNIDGTSSPSLVSSYNINTHSQISVALSTESNNPDYFYDWYAPLSAIGNPSSIRLLGTTVASPNSALQGNRSDIYGIDDANYTNNASAWQAVIEAQPIINLTSFSGVSATCTAAPRLSAPIATGSSISVSGTWTRLDASKPSTATISLYRNDVLVSTTSVSTGGTWNITVPTINSGDVFYAKAVSTGESECLISNKVQAVGCTNQTPLTGVSITCGTIRGFDGLAPTNSVVRIYTVTTSGYTLFADETTTTYKVIRSGTSWKYEGANSQNNDPCGGGAPDVSTASYVVRAQISGQCESDNINQCVGLTQTATPTITQSTLTDASTVVSGTAVANSLVRLTINGQLYTTATATGGTFSFSSLVLRAGDEINVSAQTTGQCVSVKVSRTVVCLTAPPSINTDKNGNLIVGATTITGKSVEPVSTTIRVYDELNALQGTTTVLANGTWSLTVTVAAGKSYYATAQNGTCTLSTNSTSAPALSVTTTCPTITSSVEENTTPVSGTLPTSYTGTVRLYQDDVLIGSQSVTAATVWSITPSMPLYNGGVIMATAQSAGSAESTGCASQTASCTSPSTPSITPTSQNIYTGQRTSIDVSNVNASTWYALLDASGVSYATSMYRTTGSNFTIQTIIFNSVGTFTLNLSADKLSGCPATYSVATINVSEAPLAVEFTSISAFKTKEGVQVLWEVAQEVDVDYYQVESSDDGINFESIGWVGPKKAGQSNQYAYLDKSMRLGGQTIYYRVKEVDLDGKFEYSRLVSIVMDQNTVMTILPNPAAHQADISISFEFESELSALELIDVNGRKVYEKSITLEKGENTLVIDNLEKQPRGYYLLRLQTSRGAVYTRLMLQ